MSKVLLDVRHEAVYLEAIYLQLLEIREGGEATEGGAVEALRGEIVVKLADT